MMSPPRLAFNGWSGYRGGQRPVAETHDDSQGFRQLSP